MRRFRVSIQRSELLSIPDSVGEWEIPILQLVHGAEAVAIGEPMKDTANYPAPAVEYARLERRYGENPATGASRVAEVYGPAPGGIRILMEAIKDAATELNTPDSMNGPAAEIMSELNEEIAAPGAAVDVEADLAELTGDEVDAPAPAPVPAPKPAPAPKAAKAPAKAPAKQLIAKSAPAKAAVVPTPAQPTDPLAIEE